MFMLLKKNNHNSVMYWQGACTLQTYRYMHVEWTSLTDRITLYYNHGHYIALNNKLFKCNNANNMLKNNYLYK